MQSNKQLVIALPKGRLGEDTENLMIASGWIKEGIPKDSRKLIFDVSDQIRFLMVRAQDVATYVEMGTADVGVVGKDVLLELQPDVLELLDLGFGYCKMVVAAQSGMTRDDMFNSSFLRVATKYSTIAKRFFSNLSIQPEIIKLYGSVELGAVTGMADCIVDIVSTGTTLKENGLAVIEEIFESTARLICNRAGYYQKLDSVKQLVKDLDDVLRSNSPSN